MKLRDVLNASGTLEEHDVVYARRPWSLDSEASVIRYEESQQVERLQPGAPDLEYFLEAPLLQDIRKQVEEAGRSSEEVLAMLLYYAENDAFPL